jgi:C4-dicarboxylate-specific signal transduction histidine kinase
VERVLAIEDSRVVQAHYIVKTFYAGELLARVGLHLASRRERRLALEVERLKLLREMAVALCHEINNPLLTLSPAPAAP